MPSEAFERYRLLEERLIHVRWRRRGLESPEEDALLDEMDGAWWALDDEERRAFDQAGSRSLIRPPELPSRLLVDRDPNASPTEPPRRLEEVA